ARIDKAIERGTFKRSPRIISDAKWEQLTLKPADAEWVEARNFTIQDIARLFGLHGIWLNADAGSSLTYSTTESLFRKFVSGTLWPTYLERIQQAFTRLLPEGKEARYNVSELVRADRV